MSAYRLSGIVGTLTNQPLIDHGTMARVQSAVPSQVSTALQRSAPSPSALPKLRVLRQGMHGDDVIWLQSLLNKRLQPSPPLVTDGEFGPATEHAVRNFQAHCGLAADGIVGTATWLCLHTGPLHLDGVEHNPTSASKQAPRPSSVPKPRPLAAHESDVPCPWMNIARAESGTREVPGAQHNHRILAYHATTSLRAQSDEIAWCSSFVNWVMREAGYNGTNSAAAASWIQWGMACSPREGAIVVIRNGRAANSSLTTTGNHVGFLVDETDTHYVILGGNQADQVKESLFRKSSWALRACRWPGP